MIEIEAYNDENINILDEMFVMRDDGITVYWGHDDDLNNYEAFQEFLEMHGIDEYVEEDMQSMVIVRYKNVNYVISIEGNGDTYNHIISFEFEELDNPYDYEEELEEQMYH